MSEIKSIDPEKLFFRGLIAERSDMTLEKNIFALDIDNDFLEPFKKKHKKGGYIGLGKFIDAIVHYAYFNKSKKVIALKEHTINKIIEYQLSNGYIGMYLPESRIKKTWDIHETSYIIYGLLSDYHLFKNEQSLNAAVKAADYILSNLTEENIKALHNLTCGGKGMNAGISRVCIELGTLGFERAFISLYHATGENRYLFAAKDSLGLSTWNKDIVLGRFDGIEGQAYTYLYRCLAQLELYEIDHSEKWLSKTKRVLDFLLGKGGLVITGSCGMNECWHNNQIGDGHLGESCATAYLIYLLDRLLKIEGKALYGDMMERAIYNALFAAQSSDGRYIRYYSPFEGERKFYKNDTWCCPNNFRRVMSKLPWMIYYTGKNKVLVNLYTFSYFETNIEQSLLKLNQETDYPNSGDVTLKIGLSKNTVFSIMLRRPGWCNDFELLINGEQAAYSLKDGFICIEREWKNEDIIEFKMQMPVRQVRGFFKQAGKVAIMRGPVLFCLNGKQKADLSPETIIDPKTFECHVSNLSFRQNGITCSVKTENSEKELILKEFPDPDGEQTYFRTSEIGSAVDDELLDRESLRKTEPVNVINTAEWDGGE